MADKTIAWIDDDAAALEPLIWPLKREGFKMRIYFSIREALEDESELLECDALILDILLPQERRGRREPVVENGVALLHALREKGYEKGIIVLSVVTASWLGTNREQLIELGVQEENILRKPSTTASELLDRVRLILSDPNDTS